MKKMKFYTLIVAGIFNVTMAFAQPKAVGDSIPDMQMTDINGKSFSLYQYLNEGYTVVFDISATWCGPCWNFHKSHTLKDLYEQYGPNGTMQKKLIMPIFIEGDKNTDGADLKGTGTKTQGDWVTGSPYHIVDATSSSQYITPLYKPGTNSIAFPTFVVVCPDRKVALSQEGAGGQVNLNNLVNLAKNTCKPIPASAVDIIGANSLKVYPNPVSDQLRIEFNALSSAKAKLAVVTMTGQKLLEDDLRITIGQQMRTIDASNWPSGLYMVIITTEDGILMKEKINKN